LRSGAFAPDCPVVIFVQAFGLPFRFLGRIEVASRHPACADELPVSGLVALLELGSGANR